MKPDSGHAVSFSGAWIITGGTHTGVMKHVGQAVRDYALSSSMQGKIVAIGVATWGVIHNRDKLVHPEVGFTHVLHLYVADPHHLHNLLPFMTYCLSECSFFFYLQGCFPAHYLMDTKSQGQLSCLDNNHTHFLLVDDGTNEHYGVEIELRSHLEKCISKKRLGLKG